MTCAEELVILHVTGSVYHPRFTWCHAHQLGVGLGQLVMMNGVDVIQFPVYTETRKKAKVFKVQQSGISVNSLL